MSFPTYPAYKDSGVDWLGEVPLGWRVGNLKHALVELVSGGTPESNNSAYWSDGDGIPWVAISDMTRGSIVDSTAKSLTEAGLKSKGLRVIPAGGLLYSIYASIGKVAVLGLNAATNQAILGLMLDSQVAEQSFIKWWLVSLEGWVKTMASSNTQDNLNAEKVRNLPLVFPSLLEQAQVAHFLDHQTARIDALIEEQQRLIELLKEKRQAVISHAVTKGLDPTVPMKNSGVEWLGEVPAHWQVGALGYFAGIDTGATPDRGNPEYWGGDIPWIKTGEVNYENISQAEEHITREGVKNSAAKVAPKGTLLMAMYGQGVTRGRVAILDIEAAYNQACAGIFVDSRIRVEYLRLFFIAAYPYIRDGGNETSQMNLSSGHIAKINITVPPISEQMSVEHFLNTEMVRFDSLINEAGLLATHLQERRSALISAAVTGKIDVRGWQPPASTQAHKLEVAEAV